MDVREGRVATEGWTETVEVAPEDVIAELSNRGASQLVYTMSIATGCCRARTWSEVRRVAQAAHGGSVIYSGGIGQLTDLEGLAGLGEASLEGVIVGKALYERRFTVAEAQEVLKA